MIVDLLRLLLDEVTAVAPLEGFAGTIPPFESGTGRRLWADR